MVKHNFLILIFLTTFFRNTSAMEITEIQKLPTEIIKVMITSAVLQELTNNPQKPNISLLATAAQLNKECAESMVVLYKQLIDQGAQLLNKCHYEYIKYNLKTPIARAILDFNEKNIDMRLDNSTIIAAMDHPYFMINYRFFDYTHLGTACLYRKPCLVETLLKKGASITSDNFIKTAKCEQSEEKDGIACAQLLLEQDPTVINAFCSTGFNALHWSAGNGTNNMVQFLIDHKADVNISGLCRRTSLHEAILNSEENRISFNKPSITLKTIQLLIAAGGNPLKKINTGDYHGCTAFDLVKKFHTQDNVLTLFGQQLWDELRKCKDVERSHGTATYMGTTSTVEKKS